MIQRESGVNCIVFMKSLSRNLTGNNMTNKLGEFFRIAAGVSTIVACLIAVVVLGVGDDLISRFLGHDVVDRVPIERSFPLQCTA